MKTYTIKSQPREVLGKKVKKYRREGFIPAVLYGGSQHAALPLLVHEKTFGKLFREAGESSLIALEVEGKDARNVVVHDVERDPVSNRVLHVDFFEVRMDKKMHARVSVVFRGESPAVKNEGGILVHPIQEVTVACLPQDLPHEIVADVSRLATFTDVIRAGDLALPQGVTLHGMDADDVVALVEEPRSEADIAKLAETVDEKAAVAQVQVVSEEERKKKEAEAAASA